MQQRQERTQSSTGRAGEGPTIRDGGGDVVDGGRRRGDGNPEPPPSSASNNGNNGRDDDDGNDDGRPRQNKKHFHDYSADLHDCATWNAMCVALDRIAPPSNLLPVVRGDDGGDGDGDDEYDEYGDGAYGTYRRLLRRHVPPEYALLHEANEGVFDAGVPNFDDGGGGGAFGRAPPPHRTTDMRLPLAVVYVASVQCHAHSDWTAWLVDELHGVASAAHDGDGGSGERRRRRRRRRGDAGGRKRNGGDGSRAGGDNSNNGGGGGGGGTKCGRGMLCWIEESMVKARPQWVRPGVVWLLEGAKLAPFRRSRDDDGGAADGSYDDDRDDDVGNNASAYYDHRDDDAARALAATNDASPSTDDARAGGRGVDRMVLVSESWTHTEAGGGGDTTRGGVGSTANIMQTRCGGGTHTTIICCSDESLQCVLITE